MSLNLIGALQPRRDRPASSPPPWLDLAGVGSSVLAGTGEVWSSSLASRRVGAASSDDLSCLFSLLTGAEKNIRGLVGRGGDHARGVR